MELGYTLHSIIRGKEAVPVGTVAEFSRADLIDLIKVGAVREPTEDELRLYDMANPVAKSPEPPQSTDSGKAKGGAKATKSKDPEPEPVAKDDESGVAKDPDVAEDPLV